MGFSNIDPAGLEVGANWSLHHFMRVSVDMGALQSFLPPLLTFLAGIPWTSQISIQRPLNQLQIIGYITLFMYPSRRALWSHRRPFWLASN
jgi:hypothetical protein